MMRVLVSLSPRMYCEAVAHSVHTNRPGLEVRCVPPEDAEQELGVFRPHLLVHNDTAPIPEGALAGVARRVEVLYSDSVSARVVSDGREEEVGDMDLGGLLAAVDAAEQGIARGAAVQA